MLKVVKSTCGKFWCLSACKKSTSSLTFFLRYCKDFANLLFWKPWKSLTIPIKNHSINLQETFILICMQQINFIIHFFWRYCKEIANLLFWVIWTCPTTPKYQFEKIFDVYLQAKDQFHSFHFPSDIAKIFQISFSRYFGEACLHTPTVTLAPCRKLLYLSTGKRATSSPMFF